MNKTGTQLNRVCDMGVAQWPPTVNHPKPRTYVVATCVMGFSSSSSADSILRNIGRALAKAL